MTASCRDQSLSDTASLHIDDKICDIRSMSSTVIVGGATNSAEYISETSTEQSPIHESDNSQEHAISKQLSDLRIKNLHRVCIGHININFIRNKFEMLSAVVASNIDILMISETKIDNSCPDAQFYIDGYSSPYRFDRKGNGGGILVYVRSDIPSKLLERNFENQTEYALLEINLRKKKWFLCCSYNPHKSMIRMTSKYIR